MNTVTKTSKPSVKDMWDYYTKAGCTMAAIATRYGYSDKQAVYRLFKLAGFVRGVVERKCELPECGAPFTTKDLSQKACCRSHVKLLISRRNKGLTISQVPCALAECQSIIWAVHKIGQKPHIGSRQEHMGSAKRFCCMAHASLHKHRVRTGQYAAALSQSAIKCEVCGYDRCLDEHHEKWERKGGSDKSSPTHWLCPNCHALIHRGFADYVSGVFTLLPGKLFPSQLAASIKAKASYFDYHDLPTVAACNAVQRLRAFQIRKP
jgi:hypothetical protein